MRRTLRGAPRFVKALPFPAGRGYTPLAMRRVCEHLCPRFQLAMDVISRRWNGLIMASLEDGPVRFSELLERIEHVGDRMLSARLKDLQARGLVDRRVIPGPPVRVEYELTAAGRGFQAVFEAIARWGQTLALGEPSRSRPRKRAPVPRARVAKVTKVTKVTRVTKVAKVAKRR